MASAAFANTATPTVLSNAQESAKLAGMTQCTAEGTLLNVGNSSIWHAIKQRMALAADIPRHVSSDQTRLYFVQDICLILMI